jgi:hypothetical protein
MIWESGYWKEDLIKDADILMRWARKKPSNRQYVLFEKKVFISAYSIRKLLEAEKIGPDFPMWTFGVSKFLKKTRDKIDYMNSHHIERFYDLDTPIKDSISIAFLSDKLIHSYIFSLKFNESGEVTAFLFTSDNSKEEYIYEMQIENFANLLQWIGYSDVINCHQVRDSKQPSGFKIKREYCFDDRIPRKGLPQKIKINYLSSYIETCLEAKSRSNLLPET